MPELLRDLEEHLKEEKENSLKRGGSNKSSSLFFPLESKQKLLQIPSKYLAYFKFLLEGYDHLAYVTILDGKKGIINLCYDPKEEESIEKFVKEFQEMTEILYCS